MKGKHTFFWILFGASAIILAIKGGVDDWRERRNEKLVLSEQQSLVESAAVASGTQSLAQLSVLDTKTTKVTIGGKTITAALADTPELRERGLGGVQKLNADQGMLFVFPTEGAHSFWMQDTLMPLDIIWINDEWRIVHIERAVSPDSYPQTFVSETPAQYVLELAGGTTDALGVYVGDAIAVDLSALPIQN